jgi:hypothetical protein
MTRLDDMRLDTSTPVHPVNPGHKSPMEGVSLSGRGKAKRTSGGRRGGGGGGGGDGAFTEIDLESDVGGEAGEPERGWAQDDDEFFKDFSLTPPRAAPARP